MNLRERAAMAFLDKKITDEANLVYLAREHLRDLLDAEPDDLAVADIDAYGTPPCVRFDVEGMKFRVNVTVKTHTAGEKDSNTGLQWDEEKITAYVTKPPSEHSIECLADVGRIFNTVDLPPLEGDPEPEEVPMAKNFGLQRDADGA